MFVCSTMIKCHEFTDVIPSSYARERIPMASCPDRITTRNIVYPGSSPVTRTAYSCDFVCSRLFNIIPLTLPTKIRAKISVSRGAAVFLAFKCRMRLLRCSTLIAGVNIWNDWSVNYFWVMVYTRRVMVS
jgi:hypothetical protein